PRPRSLGRWSRRRLPRRARPGWTLPRPTRPAIDAPRARIEARLRPPLIVWAAAPIRPARCPRRRWRRRHELRRQLAADVGLPDRAAVSGVHGERGIEGRDEANDVVEVAEEEELRARAVH